MIEKSFEIWKLSRTRRFYQQFDNINLRLYESSFRVFKHEYKSFEIQHLHHDKKFSLIRRNNLKIKILSICHNDLIIKISLIHQNNFFANYSKIKKTQNRQIQWKYSKNKIKQNVYHQKNIRFSRYEKIRKLIESRKTQE